MLDYLYENQDFSAENNYVIVILTKMKIKAQQSGSKPSDKLLPTNVKSAKHQILHEQAVKEFVSGVQYNPKSKGKPFRKRKGNPPQQKGGKKKKFKKGRAKLEKKSDECKLEYPSQYDTSKIPPGLKSFHQLSTEDQSIFEAQLENEGIKYSINLD